MMDTEETYVEKDVDLRDYLRVLYKRRSMVCTFFIIIVTLTLVVTFSTTPMYEGTAKLLIEKNEENPFAAGLGALGRDPEFLETQSQIIKSTPVGLKVVQMMNLEETYNAFFEQQTGGFSLVAVKQALVGWTQKFLATGLRIIGVAEADFVVDPLDIEKAKRLKAERIAGTISSEITVRPMRDSRIVTLNYLSPNPVLAAGVVNSVAKAYIDKTYEMKMEASGHTLKWMTEQAEKERQKLEKSERALQQYMEKNDIVTIENKVTITPQKLADLNSRLISIQARRKELELTYGRVSSLAGNLEAAESTQVIASDPAIQSLRGQILEAEKMVMDLSKKYGPKHPVMKRAQADLEVLYNKRKKEIKRVISSVKNEYDLVVANEREFEDQLEKTKQDAVKLNENFIQYRILSRDVETNKELYNALITKIKEQNVAEQAQSVKVWVVEKAKIPEHPAKPNKKRNIVLGIVLGLFAGLGLAFFVEYLDNKVKSPDDIEERFGLPILGTVTMLDLKSKQPEKEAIDNPSSAFAESFKTIRTSVLLSSSDSPPRRLLIASVAPEEGKTTCAVNLASSMVQAEKRVLLIDADMRRPRIHKILGLENDEGLSSYLAGASDAAVIRKGPFHNLDVITSGPVPPNPSDLLSSRRAGNLVKSAEEKYDFILIDSPPMLTVSDPLMLSKLAQGVIIIVRAGKTPYDMLAKGLKTLDAMGAQIMGVVLNAIDMKKSGYYYYDQYYGAKYKEDDENAA